MLKFSCGLTTKVVEVIFSEPVFHSMMIENYKDVSNYMSKTTDASYRSVNARVLEAVNNLLLSMKPCLVMIRDTQSR